MLLDKIELVQIGHIPKFPYQLDICFTQNFKIREIGKMIFHTELVTAIKHLCHSITYYLENMTLNIEQNIEIWRGGE